MGITKAGGLGFAQAVCLSLADVGGLNFTEADCLFSFVMSGVVMFSFEGAWAQIKSDPL